jgi:MFS family permease
MCLIGMIVFTSCSLVSGFAKNMELLFVCRGLSGLGSAMASTAGYREWEEDGD